MLPTWGVRSETPLWGCRSVRNARSRMWGRAGDRGEPHYGGKEGVNNSSQTCPWRGWMDNAGREGPAQHFLCPGGPGSPKKRSLSLITFKNCPLHL